MVTILFTKGNGLTIKSCFNASTCDFNIIVEYPDGSEVLYEVLHNISSLVEEHDKACKSFGLLRAKTA